MATDVGRSDDLLSVARATAVRVGRDSAREPGVFGRRVATMHAVEQAVRRSWCAPTTATPAPHTAQHVAVALTA